MKEEIDIIHDVGGIYLDCQIEQFNERTKESST